MSTTTPSGHTYESTAPPLLGAPRLRDAPLLLTAPRLPAQQPTSSPPAPRDSPPAAERPAVIIDDFSSGAAAHWAFGGRAVDRQLPVGA